MWGIVLLNTFPTIYCGVSQFPSYIDAAGLLPIYLLITMIKKKLKAIALLSGGLDSALAIKLVQEQGVEVTGVYFTSPFFARERGGKPYARIIAEKLEIPIMSIDLGMEYLKVIKHPKHGHGAGINPCVDCKVHMLKKAKKLMKELKADFIITGEVLNQRPMSQHYRALLNIEKDAGLEGRLLRPLSAQRLPQTEPEKKGLVDRKKLLDIQGRQRKHQAALAQKFGINEFSPPAGGCLLTQQEFSKKLRDLIQHKKRITLDDIYLLKVGRHFRQGKNKIIVGKNEKENQEIIARKKAGDLIFEVPGYGSPATLLDGPKTKNAIALAARLTARYSDCKSEKVLVKYGKGKLTHDLIVEPITQAEADRINLTKYTPAPKSLVWG